MRSIKYNYSVTLLVEGKSCYDTGSFMVYQEVKPEYTLRNILVPLYGEGFYVSKVTILKDDF